MDIAEQIEEAQREEIKNLEKKAIALAEKMVALAYEEGVEADVLLPALTMATAATASAAGMPINILVGGLTAYYVQGVSLQQNKTRH